jgi:hypothetical protein
VQVIRDAAMVCAGRCGHRLATPATPERRPGDALINTHLWRSLINIPPLQIAVRHRSVWTALVRPSPTLPAVADRPEAVFHGLILVHQPGNFPE